MEFYALRPGGGVRAEARRGRRIRPWAECRTRSACPPRAACNRRFAWSPGAFGLLYGWTRYGARPKVCGPGEPRRRARGRRLEAPGRDARACAFGHMASRLPGPGRPIWLMPVRRASLGLRLSRPLGRARSGNRLLRAVAARPFGPLGSRRFSLGPFGCPAGDGDSRRKGAVAAARAWRHPGMDRRETASPEALDPCGKALHVRLS